MVCLLNVYLDPTFEKNWEMNGCFCPEIDIRMKKKTFQVKGFELQPLEHSGKQPCNKVSQTMVCLLTIYQDSTLRKN